MANVNFPILAGDRLDYVDGAYETRVRRAPKGTGMAVRHTVAGSNLVASLLKGNKAAFAVEISSPYATYRRIRKAESNGATELTQQVSWDAEDVVPPVYVRPLVIATAGQPTSFKLNGRHGVHELWQGVEISVAPGTILAQDHFWRASSTWESLIRLVSNDTMPRGTYRVEMNTGEGFHFNVQLHPDLYSWMANPEDAKNHRNSILTGCLARALELIHAEYGEGDAWREFPVLRALHRKLVDKGLETWDDNKDFHADEVASRLRPIDPSAKHDG